MIKREIAVVVSNANKGVHAFDTIDAIQKAGYKNVFIQWYHRAWNPTQEEQLKYIKEKGLNVIFAHLGYENINDLWLETDEGDLLVERYKRDIKVCKENAILMVVMHLTNEKEAPKRNKVAIKRLQEIADYAKSLGVKIAFENTRFQGYLEYVIENIKNDNVGICFDSGHCHLYFDDDFHFSKFADKIFAIHLHDNDKKKDLHLIPFDGTIDWQRIIKELKNCNYDGPITMELVYRNDYLQMSVDSFYKKGYEAGEKIRRMFEME